MASTYLTRAMNGNSEYTGTISLWIKRASLGQNVICSFWEDSSTYQRLQFDSSDRLNWKIYDNNNLYGEVTSTRVFRDTNAWYHIVSRVDTTQSTASDRVRLYVNGNLITNLDTTNYPTQNRNVKQSAVPYIGTEGTITSARFDGCMSHIHYTDATSNAPTVFGETDATTGEWKIKTNVSTTYGAKGFFILKDGNSGTDHSGNSNNFTASGNLTNTEDCPSNVFPTINRLARCVYSSLGSLTDGNTTAQTVASGHWGSYIPTIGASSGKYYMEAKHISGSDVSVGIWDMDDTGINQSTSWYAGQHSTDVAYQNNGDYYVNGSNTSAWNTFTSGDIIGIAMDLDNRKAYFHKNGVYQGSGNPTAGTGGLTIPADLTMGFGVCAYNGAKMSANYGNGYFGTTAISSEGTNASGIGKFEYDVPTGYTALSTKGLNE